MSIFNNKDDEILEQIQELKAGIMDLKYRLVDIESWMIQQEKTGKKSVPIWKRWVQRKTGFSKEL
jgi:hypothetical protein|tara:strand:- start:1048 stop:1242 length:195 start_codon:yes stop_codon:yes gene_type:complete